MGKLSEKIRELIARQVKHRGIVVWCDPERAYATLVQNLSLPETTVPIEQRTIAGKTVHSIGAGTLLVCLAPAIAREEVEPLALGLAAWHKELAPVGDAQVVFRDSGFAADVAKTNMTAILQQHGLENVRSL